MRDCKSSERFASLHGPILPHRRHLTWSAIQISTSSKVRRQFPCSSGYNMKAGVISSNWSSNRHGNSDPLNPAPSQTVKWLESRKYFSSTHMVFLGCDYFSSLYRFHHACDKYVTRLESSERYKAVIGWRKTTLPVQTASMASRSPNFARASLKSCHLTSRWHKTAWKNGRYRPAMSESACYPELHKCDETFSLNFGFRVNYIDRTFRFGFLCSIWILTQQRRPDCKLQMKHEKANKLQTWAHILVVSACDF
jgi:hypothetical protein